MINKIEENDIVYINKLGKNLNPNFAKLFHIYKLNENETIYKYENNNHIEGFIHIQKFFETIDILNIIVDKDKRKNGIGSELINYIIKNNPNISNIMLEVRESNIDAINFYKSLNFIEINRRKKYYINEDAIIMERKIK